MANNSNILNALKSEFSTQAYPIYINELGKEVLFRDISALEQKTFSKTIIANEERPDLVYSAQLALIQDLCLDKSINVLDLSEFDRIKILLVIYQSNFKTSSAEVECPMCNTKLNISIDFSKTAENLNKINLDNIVVVEKALNDNYEITFTLNYPSCRRVQEYREYQRSNGGFNNKTFEASFEASFSFEMMDLFIKHMKIHNLTTGNIIEVDPSTMSYSEYMTVLNVIPKDLIYSPDSNISTTIRDRMFTPVEEAFETTKCPQCGHTIKGVGSIGSFFTF